MNVVAGVALAVALGVSAVPAAPVNARVARVAAEWQKLGPRALPAIARAYCDEDDPALSEAAERELRGRGLPAFDALFRHRDRACEAGQLAGQILCQAQPLDDGALRSSLARAVAPLLSERAETGAVDLESLLGLPVIAPRDRLLARNCPTSQRLSAALLDVLLTPANLARARPGLRSSIALTLPAALAWRSDRRAATLSVLAQWLDANDGSSAAVVDALAAMGPDAAPAVPALQAYLARGIDRSPAGRNAPRRLRAATLLPLAKVAAAAAAIGSAARPMLGTLRDALDVAASRMCTFGRSDDEGAVLEAIATIDASAWKTVAATAEAAWRRAGQCERSPLSIGDPGVRGRDRLMDAVAAFGPAAASFHAVLRPLVTDARASLEARGRAARTLRRIGARLDGRDAPLAGVLEARFRRRATPPGQRAARLPAPPHEIGAQTALDALTDCKADASLVDTKPLTPRDMTAFSYDENRTFRDCVEARLCGPGPDVLDETLATCCAFAYQRGRPGFCATQR